MICYIFEKIIYLFESFIMQLYHQNFHILFNYSCILCIFFGSSCLPSSFYQINFEILIYGDKSVYSSENFKHKERIRCINSIIDVQDHQPCRIQVLLRYSTMRRLKRIKRILPFPFQYTKNHYHSSSEAERLISTILI